MLRATHRVAGRFVLAALGTTLALSACQPAPAAAPTARKASLGAHKAPDGIVPLDRPLQPEPFVQVRAHQAAPLLMPVAPDAYGGRSGGLAVQAATGGVYRSADGSVEVVIPPGALDRDAVVRFEALPTQDLPAYSSYLPGIRVAADLGGAGINPGHTLFASARLAPQTVGHLRALSPGLDLDTLGFSPDGAGGTRLTMPLRGPAQGLVPVTGAPRDTPAWEMVEFGGPTAAATSTRRLLAAGEPLKVIAAKMPTTWQGFYDLELAGVFGCDVAATCLLNMIRKHQNEGGEIVPEQCGMKFETLTPSPAPDPTDKPIVAPPSPPGPVAAEGSPAPPVVRDPLPLPCRVTWVSNDPRVNGQPAVGALVKFRLPGMAGMGPNEVLTNDQGLASTFAPEGWQAFPTATKAPGRAVDEGRPVTVRPGMPPVELTLVKNLPIIALHVISKGGKPLGETLHLSFEVAGRPGTLDLALVAPEANETMSSFTVQIAGDLPEAFSFTGAQLGDGRQAVKLPTPVDVTWNGIYPLEVVFTSDVFLAPK